MISLLSTLAGFFVDPWHDVVGLGLLAYVVYAAREARRAAIVVKSFAVLPTIDLAGDTPSNMLRDCFNDIQTRARKEIISRSGKLVRIGQRELKLPEFGFYEIRPGHLADPLSVQFQAGGVSFLPWAPLIALFRRLWSSKVHELSGDIIRNRDGTFQLIVRSGEDHWEVAFGRATREDLEPACDNVAMKVLENLDPALWGTYQMTIGNYAVAYQVLRTQVAVAHSPGLMKRLYESSAVLLASEELEQGDDSGAFQLLQEASILLPKSATLTFNLGNLHYWKGEVDQAALRYEAAIQLKRKFPEALNNLGLTLQEQGRYSEAKARYRKALKARRDSPPALYNLANLLLNERRGDEAIGLFRRAIQLDPDYWEAEVGVGMAESIVGRFDDAMAHYRRALELRENDSAALTQLATALGLKGFLDDSISTYEEVLKAEPESIVARFNLDLIRHQQSLFQEVLEDPTSAVEANKSGQILMLMSHPSAAIACFRIAIKLEPNNPEAHRHLGDCLLVNGVFDEAAREHAEAQRLRLKASSKNHVSGIRSDRAEPDRPTRPGDC